MIEKMHEFGRILMLNSTRSFPSTLSNLRKELEYFKRIMPNPKLPSVSYVLFYVKHRFDFLYGGGLVSSSKVRDPTSWP